MTSVKDLLEKTGVILLVFIVLGFFLSLSTTLFRYAVDYLLGIMMFFSIRPFFQHKLNIRKRLKFMVLSLFLNYVVLSGMFLILAYLLFEPLSPYRAGFFLLAIIPPAISIVPLCNLTQCDPETADASLFFSFLLSLIIIPVAISVLSSKSFDIMPLLRIMLVVIIIPLVLAYLARKSPNKIFDYTKAISNVCIGLVLFIAISLNRHSFPNFDTDLLKIIITVVLAIFALGFATYHITRKYFPESEARNFALYATQKNEGTALAISIAMFAPATVVPILIALLGQFIYFLIFERLLASS